MNERIKELQEQAESFAQTALVESYGGMQAYFDIVIAKFAELIVGHAIECVRDVLRDENSDLNYTAASQVQNRIKECFGVEE